MLVIDRKPQQGFHINDNIHVYILSMDGKKVRLGIDAPKSHEIMRDELYEKRKKERQNDFKDEM